MSAARTMRVSLDELRRMKADGRKFAMLTAYDYPTAAAAQAAGVHSLLIGDSMGTVILGHANTRGVPLDLMITLGEAVRRGAPNVYLVGDLPYRAMGSVETVVAAASRFSEDAACDAVKFEAAPGDDQLVSALTSARIETIAHLGLRPQSVSTPEGYRAQARDEESIRSLVADARRMVEAGAVMLLLEAVPAEASQAVVNAVDVPVIGCGGGPACDGHVVVTHDMLGIGAMPPPRFVPVHAQLGEAMENAMRCWVESIAEGHYPGREHVYGMRRSAPASSSASS